MNVTNKESLNIKKIETCKTLSIQSLPYRRSKKSFNLFFCQNFPSQTTQSLPNEYNKSP